MASYCPKAVKGRLRWFLRDIVERAEVLQIAIDRLKARSYLEIGVGSGETFASINAAVKIGVDPCNIAERVKQEVALGKAQYFQMTSDEFFLHNAQVLKKAGIDVAFVDGLHTYEQSLVDCENCLGCLSEGGLIFLHDCRPLSEARAVPASSFLQAKEMKIPGWDGLWNGDVWKTIVHLRSLRRDLKVCVLDCDHGIGVVMKGEGGGQLVYSCQDIQNLSYREFERTRKPLLNLQPACYLFRVLNEAVRHRVQAAQRSP